MPLFHLGGRGVVCTHHRASNSESVERIERPGAIQQAPFLMSGPYSKKNAGKRQTFFRWNSYNAGLGLRPRGEHLRGEVEQICRAA